MVERCDENDSEQRLVSIENLRKPKIGFSRKLEKTENCHGFLLWDWSENSIQSYTNIYRGGSESCHWEREFF